MSVNQESKHYDAYYDHVLNRNKATGSVGKIYDIISNLTDRHGLQQEWESIDSDIQDEIIESWTKILDKE